VIDSFNPPGVWSPFGAFSMGVVQGEGQVVYLKGQVALDADGRVVGKGDMRAQAEQVLENIKVVLAAVGGEMSDIVSLTQFVTDIEAFMGVGEVRSAYFSEPYPVTTTVEISRLYDADLMVEITAIAEIPRDRFRRPPASPTP
jgi:2-iminobutanoate/2-iminopropanoate deaminase